MAAVGVGVLFLVSVLLRGWVLSVLWTWFVVPLGAPVVGVPQALGLSALLTMFTSDTSTKQETQAFSLAVVLSIIISLLMLGLGAIYHAFM